MSLTVFGISKSNFQPDQKKIPLLVRTFRSDLSTGFGKQSSYTSRRNFQIRTLLNIFFDPFFHGVLFGFLKVAYGTIYNKAFNSVCVIVVSILALDICRGVYGLAFLTPVQNIMKSQGMLVIFNDIYCLLMIFLCTFFAYDSAKMQLKKVKLSK